MRENDVFVLADRTLNHVVEQIADDQWDMKMPASFARADDPDNIPTLRSIIGSHAYDDAWVPDMLAGRTMDEVGTTRFDGDLLGDDPKASFNAIVEKACAAAAQAGDLDRTVHCSFGDFPVFEYFWQLNGFRGVRAWDIAKAIGVDPTLPGDLVKELWDEISPVADEWRKFGVFPEPVHVAEDAPLQQRLLGLVGRDSK
jgi:uncharacterized protein (TIGR03086 family)